MSDRDDDSIIPGAADAPGSTVAAHDVFGPLRRIRHYIDQGSTYGKLIILVGTLMAGPLLTLPFFPAELQEVMAFLIPSVMSLSLGFTLCFYTHQRPERISEYQTPVERGSLPVIFIWSYSFVVGALPYLITDLLNPIQALFESVSSWTTTGITLLDADTTSPIILFYHCFSEYFGGLGLILMMTLVIRGKNTMSLNSAEGHTDQVAPGLRQTARFVFIAYAAITVIGAVFYRVFGMSTFDAICHSMSSITTSGFSTKSDGITAYDSLAIEVVTIILMLLGALNFTVLLMFTEGKIHQVLRSTELRFSFGFIGIFVLLCAISFTVKLNMGLGESFRVAAFSVISYMSTTGFVVADHSILPAFAQGLILILLVVGGGSGSTSGGIKQLRAYLLLRATRENIVRRLSPAIRTVSPSFNTVRSRVAIDQNLINDTVGYFSCYFGILIIGTLLLTVTSDCSLSEAMFEFSSALSTSGVYNSYTNINSNSATLLVQMAGMILGRLEIFVVFFGLSSFISRVRRFFTRSSR